MKKLIIIASSCFFLVGCSDQTSKNQSRNWIKVQESIEANFYVDVNSIEKRNNIVYFWKLIDLLEPNKFGIFSLISKYKVDCIEGKQTGLSQTNYSRPMGKGKIISDLVLSEVVTFPKPNTVGYDLIKFTCDRAK